MKMTDEQLDKVYLCDNLLTPLIRFVLDRHYTAKYVLEDDGEEYVHLINQDGVILRRIKVTMDSLTALAQDVINKI